ncbi:uncharacterized protein LOC127880095 isoform X2 [Dreissena polymorpha]|uniref:uncharacterized protein LOC127880095 isoform X2 n=1 Tax=Dreissena polymorpha TaxID=45954 RepID=UPI002264513A|nr:uncharacterized protein LOC127880095 isoform X2 [Dreissena polymorpha]
MGVLGRMFSVKVLFILVIVINDLPDSAANNSSSIQQGDGSCSFTNNDTCGYDVIGPWRIHQGQSSFLGRTIIMGGKDDDFYALFVPDQVIGNYLNNMASPLLPGGIACLSFYYTIPAATTTLQVMTRTEDNVRVELWNVTERARRNWTRVEGLVVENIDHFVVDFVARASPNGLIGIDNITIESFTCDNGYLPIKEDVMDVCAGRSNGLPKCEPVECGNASNAANAFINYFNGTTYKSYAEVTCNVGYRIMNGGANYNVHEYIQCLETGMWNMSSGCELIECGNASNAVNAVINYFNGTTYKSYAEVTCNVGYRIMNGGANGNVREYIQCLETGVWNMSSGCELIECGNASNAANAVINYFNGTTYKSYAEVTCNVGYRIINGGANNNVQEYIQCLETGVWNMSSGCELKDCGRLHVPLNGNISHHNHYIRVNGYNILSDGIHPSWKWKIHMF